MTWFYLSFADPAKPEGEQFLGATVVEASAHELAPLEAHARGINPGGEVMIFELDIQGPDDLPPKERGYINHFIPREVVLAEPHINALDFCEDGKTRH